MNSATFNQDASCIAVGTNAGYKLFNCSPFGKYYSIDDGSCGRVSMLFNTALVAVAGKGEDAHRSPRRLRVVNTKRELALCELTFPTSILNIKMNRKRLVVVLEDQIYIYNIANMKLLHTVDTVPNRKGVADLASDGTYLIYPAGQPAKHTLAPTPQSANASGPAGELIVFDCDSLAPVNAVRAHRSPLAQAVFNSDGSLVATTSDKGTLIRVFSVPSGTLLHEFRRGTYQSQVFSLAFNLPSTLLAVSSATGTVHIYKLPASAAESQEGETPNDSTNVDAPEPEENDPDTTTDTVDTKKTKKWSIRRRVSKALPKAPAAVHELWESSRSRGFAHLKLPDKTPSVLGFAAPPQSNVIYVATGSGRFLQYQIDLEHGGECEVQAEHSLL